MDGGVGSVVKGRGGRVFVSSTSAEIYIPGNSRDGISPPPNFKPKDTYLMISLCSVLATSWRSVTFLTLGMDYRVLRRQ